MGYGITCRPVRDLLVDYLRERALCVDYTSLRAVAFSLSELFWKDLEDHHPGFASLRLSPAVATAWKQRIALKTIRGTTADGDTVEMQAPRADRGLQHLAAVRAFYLDHAGAEDKLAQVVRRSHQRTVVGLGIPTTRSEDR